MTSNDKLAPAANGVPAGDGARRRPRRWLWFFAALAVLTVTAITILWVYNARQQLTPEELAAARRRWQEKGPRAYVLTYTKEGSATGTFVVTVRDREVQSVVMEQEVTENGKVKRMDVRLPERLYRRSDMPGLFDDLQGFLKIKQDPATGGRVFLRATFDPEDGHLEGYIYSNPQIGQRVKVMVRLEPGKDEG